MPEWMGLQAAAHPPQPPHVQLHFKEYGQGRAVILLHGLFGSSDNWHSLALRLSPSFHVLAPDQRNHGRSPHSDRMSYELMAADVVALMDSRGIGSAAVLGHSMGGKTAMQLALQFPDRVERLIVVDMAPRAYPPVHRGVMAALLALDLKLFSTRQAIEDALAPEIPDVSVRRFLLKNIGTTPGAGFFWKLNLRGLLDQNESLYRPVSPTPPGAGPFSKPGLFVRGGKSDYLGPDDEPLIRSLFSNAAIRTVPEAGHWVHADAPEAFFRMVLDFLRAE